MTVPQIPSSPQSSSTTGYRSSGLSQSEYNKRRANIARAEAGGSSGGGSGTPSNYQPPISQTERIIVPKEGYVGLTAKQRYTQASVERGQSVFSGTPGTSVSYTTPQGVQIKETMIGAGAKSIQTMTPIYEYQVAAQRREEAGGATGVSQWESMYDKPYGSAQARSISEIKALQQLNKPYTPQLTYEDIVKAQTRNLSAPIQQTMVYTPPVKKEELIIPPPITSGRVATLGEDFIKTPVGQIGKEIVAGAYSFLTFPLTKAEEAETEAMQTAKKLKAIDTDVGLTQEEKYRLRKETVASGAYNIATNMVGTGVALFLGGGGKIGSWVAEKGLKILQIFSAANAIEERTPKAIAEFAIYSSLPKATKLIQELGFAGRASYSKSLEGWFKNVKETPNITPVSKGVVRGGEEIIPTGDIINLGKTTTTNNQFGFRPYDETASQRIKPSFEVDIREVKPKITVYRAASEMPSETISKEGVVYAFINPELAKGWQKDKGGANIYKVTSTDYIVDTKQYVRPFVDKRLQIVKKVSTKPEFILKSVDTEKVLFSPTPGAMYGSPVVRKLKEVGKTILISPLFLSGVVSMPSYSSTGRRLSPKSKARRSQESRGIFKGQPMRKDIINIRGTQNNVPYAGQIKKIGEVRFEVQAPVDITKRVRRKVTVITQKDNNLFIKESIIRQPKIVEGALQITSKQELLRIKQERNQPKKFMLIPTQTYNGDKKFLTLTVKEVNTKQIKPLITYKLGQKEITKKEAKKLIGYDRGEKPVSYNEKRFGDIEVVEPTRGDRVYDLIQNKVLKRKVVSGMFTPTRKFRTKVHKVNKENLFLSKARQEIKQMWKLEDIKENKIQVQKIRERMLFGKPITDKRVVIKNVLSPFAIKNIRRIKAELQPKIIPTQKQSIIPEPKKVTKRDIFAGDIVFKKPMEYAKEFLSTTGSKITTGVSTSPEGAMQRFSSGAKDIGMSFPKKLKRRRLPPNYIDAEYRILEDTKDLDAFSKREIGLKGTKPLGQYKGIDIFKGISSRRERVYSGFASAAGLGSESKTYSGLGSGTTNRLGLELNVISGTKPITTTFLNIDTAQSQNIASISAQAQGVSSITIPISKQDLAQEQKQAQILKQDLMQEQILIPEFPKPRPQKPIPDIFTPEQPRTPPPERTPRPRPRVPEPGKPRQPEVPPPIKIPEPKKKPINFLKKSLFKKKSKGFKTFVRKKGKFMPISPSLSRESALDVGARYVKGTLASTFEIRETAETPLAVQTSGTFQRYAPTFRSYEIRRGQKVATPNRFIEKRATRLSTGFERTAIKQAKAFKGGKAKWF